MGYPSSTPAWFTKSNENKSKTNSNKRLSAPRGRSKKRNVSIGTIEFGEVLNGKDLKRRDSLERMKPIKVNSKKKKKKKNAAADSKKNKKSISEKKKTKKTKAKLKAKDKDKSKNKSK